MILQGAIINRADFRRISASSDPFSFWIQGDSADLQQQVQTALGAYPAAKVRTIDEWIGGQLDQIVYLLYALLAMSLMISLFGIANSLFLSIHERTRELGMLRAIGASQRQIRADPLREGHHRRHRRRARHRDRRPVRVADHASAHRPRPALRNPRRTALAVRRARRRRRRDRAIMPARRAARLDILQAVAAGE